MPANDHPWYLLQWTRALDYRYIPEYHPVAKDEEVPGWFLTGVLHDVACGWLDDDLLATGNPLQDVHTGAATLIEADGRYRVKDWKPMTIAGQQILTRTDPAAVMVWQPVLAPVIYQLQVLAGGGSTGYEIADPGVVRTAKAAARSAGGAVELPNPHGGMDIYPPGSITRLWVREEVGEPLPVHEGVEPPF